MSCQGTERVTDGPKDNASISSRGARGPGVSGLLVDAVADGKQALFQSLPAQQTWRLGGFKQSGRNVFLASQGRSSAAPSR